MLKFLILGALFAFIYNIYLLYKSKEKIAHLDKKMLFAVAFGFLFFIFLREGLFLFLDGTGSVNDFHSPTTAFLYLILLACIIAPAMEELFFRGFLLKVFSKFGVAFSTVLSSACWAAIHYDNGFWVLYIFLIGLYFCAVRLKTDSILIVIGLHGIANTLAVFLALVGI